MVRCHLDYASSVWNPFKLKYIDALENVQRRATRQLDNLILDLQPEGYDVLLMIVRLIICMAGYSE